MSEVLVKVCGVRSAGQARACALAGADWIGLNFHPGSPRSIDLDRAEGIAEYLRSANVATPVGLFVDRPARDVVEVVERVGLTLVQIHGDEPPEYLEQLVGLAGGPAFQVIRAFRLDGIAAVDRMIVHLDRAERLGCPPFAILVDAHVPGQAGGTGRMLARSILDRLPEHPRLILAGGLDPTNVAERVAFLHPWMVDVASGVESSPGVKDVAKVAAFVAAARRGAATGDKPEDGPLTRTYASD